MLCKKIVTVVCTVLYLIDKTVETPTKEAYCMRPHTHAHTCAFPLAHTQDCTPHTDAARCSMLEWLIVLWYREHNIQV